MGISFLIYVERLLIYNTEEKNIHRSLTTKDKKRQTFLEGNMVKNWFLGLFSLSFKLFQNKLYMMLSVGERTILRKRISEFIVKNPNTKNSQIINHFVQEGYAYRTVSVNINRVNKGQAIKDKKRTGRPNKLSSV